MSKLLDFYENGKLTDDGDDFVQIVVEWNNQDWEECHDFIQWLFPLPEPSKFNPDAPLLDDEFIERYKSTRELKVLVHAALDRALFFFGYHHRKDRPYWFNAGDHNMLRITRVMKFLRLIGEFQTAALIYDWLDEMDRLYPGNVSDTTWTFWEDAVYG